MNVDLTAEELRERMRSGKIYPADRATAALENFFTENNLNTLRELALRETAAALDRRPRLGGKSPTDVSEKIAVFFSTNPDTTSRLLRAASRLAGGLNREWMAVYVRRKNEDPNHIPSDVQRKFMQNVQLPRNSAAASPFWKAKTFARRFGLLPQKRRQPRRHRHQRTQMVAIHPPRCPGLLHAPCPGH